MAILSGLSAQERRAMQQAARQALRAQREAARLSRQQVLSGRIREGRMIGRVLSPADAILGLDDVLANLNAAVKAMGGPKSKAGMRRALLLIRRKSVPITPVDTGNLRNSIFTEVHQSSGEISGTIGYTADYAAEVHETPKNYRVGGWKFLQKAIMENMDGILSAIAEEIRV